MFKKDEYVRFKNWERIIKSPFAIYADFGSLLVREDNGKENQHESYTNKLKKKCCFQSKACSLVVSDLLSDTRGYWFESGC